jgi:hypothetical protein
MPTIKLEEIEAKQTEIAKMIEVFKAQTKIRIIRFPELEIELAPDEHYAGIITGKDGDLSYHLVLLPGEAESINWADAGAWAKAQGGELPTRSEQALLYANLKEEFKPDYFWSSEQHAAYSDCAWLQDFDYGSQYTDDKSYEGRARAVRRLTIQ